MADDDNDAPDPDMPAVAPPDAAPAADDDGGDSSDTSGVTGAGHAPIEQKDHYHRVISDSTRRLFAAAAPALKKQLEDDDEAPAIGNDAAPAPAVTPPAATPAPAETQAPAAAPAKGVTLGVPVFDLGAAGAAPPPAAAAPPAAPAPPRAPADGVDPALTLEVRERSIAEREKAFEARQTALGEREKELERFATLGTRYLTRGATEVVDLLKEWTGAATDDEVREEVVGLVAELSHHVLKMPIDPDIETKLSNRRSISKVRAGLSEQERRIKQNEDRLARERAEIDKRTADEKAAREKAEADQQEKTKREGVIGRLGEVLKGADAQGTTFAQHWPHLMAEAEPSRIIFSVIETQLASDPSWKPDWIEAAQLANAHYQKRNEQERERLAKIFPAPVAAAAPKPSPAATPPAPPTSHQGAPQSRGARTLTNGVAAPVAPVAPVAPTPPPSPAEDEVYDPRAARRRSTALLKAELEKRNAT